MIAGLVREPFTDPRWKALRALLKRSCVESDDTTIEEVEEALRGAQAQLWAVYDGDRVVLAAVTQLFNTEGRRIAYCWQMGGDFARGGPELVPLFLEWAANEGCVVAEINGRVGWMRRLRDWKAVSVTLRKELA